MYIFRTKRTLKDGSVIYAKDYGLKAFKIWIGPGKEPEKQKYSTGVCATNPRAFPKERKVYGEDKIKYTRCTKQKDCCGETLQKE